MSINTTKIAVISPSGFVPHDRLRKGLEVLKQWGYMIVEGSSLFSQSGYFAGKDEDRIKEFQETLDNEEVGIIHCARGGYGLSRIIDSLNFTSFIRRGGVLIGFSDITAAHLHIHKLNGVSVHGVMVAQLAQSGYASSAVKLRELLDKQQVSISVTPPAHFPKAAQVIGGNLRMIIDSIGTRDQPDLAGKVLFVEEVGEGIYKIDRMFTHMKRSGMLEGLQGLMIGHFTEVSDTTPPYGIGAVEWIENFCEREKIPCMSYFPAGHEAPNFPIVFGKPYQIISTAEGEKVMQFSL